MNCRVCGCCDSEPCFRTPAGVVMPLDVLDKLSEQELEALALAPCGWVEPDLCSACVASPRLAALILDAHGTPYGKGAP